MHSTNTSWKETIERAIADGYLVRERDGRLIEKRRIVREKTTEEFWHELDAWVNGTMPVDDEKWRAHIIQDVIEDDYRHLWSQIAQEAKDDSAKKNLLEKAFVLIGWKRPASVCPF